MVKDFLITSETESTYVCIARMGPKKPAIPAQWLFQAWNTESLSSKHICYIYMYIPFYMCTVLYIFRKINLHVHVHTPPAVSTISQVFTLEEVISTQASDGKESSFSGIVFAVLMSINIDEETRSVAWRWSAIV